MYFLLNSVGFVFQILYFELPADNLLIQQHVSSGLRIVLVHFERFNRLFEIKIKLFHLQQCPQAQTLVCFNRF